MLYKIYIWEEYIIYFTDCYLYSKQIIKLREFSFEEYISIDVVLALERVQRIPRVYSKYTSFPIYVLLIYWIYFWWFWLQSVWNHKVRFYGSKHTKWSIYRVPRVKGNFLYQTTNQAISYIFYRKMQFDE